MFIFLAEMLNHGTTNWALFRTKVLAGAGNHVIGIVAVRWENQQRCETLGKISALRTPIVAQGPDSRHTDQISKLLIAESWQ
jgi:hypothetical protein